MFNHLKEFNTRSDYTRAELHEQRRKQHRAASLERDYSMLYILNTILDRVVRFEDFESLKFHYIPATTSLIIKSDKLKIYRMVRLTQMLGEHNWVSKTFTTFLTINGCSDMVDFLLVNGASHFNPKSVQDEIEAHATIEVKEEEKPRPGWEKNYRGFWAPVQDSSKRGKWHRNSEGFWENEDEKDSWVPPQPVK